MNLDQRIEAFVQVGSLFSKLGDKPSSKGGSSDANTVYLEAFQLQIHRAKEVNGWFTKENVLKAFDSWAAVLNRENLLQWTAAYTFDQKAPPKTVAIIMAGNIPLVGFHDLLSVLISGHHALVKLSSNDPYFLPLVARFLTHTNPAFKERIRFSEEKLNGFEAVIATGSNNTARYFEYYFDKYPSIIRKNRHSMAILDGTESLGELELLGTDIFQYFGLGCRSVSKLFVPRGYDFDMLFKALYKFRDVINYKKYQNNYDYNKAVYLMSLYKLQENGFLMLKEDTSHASPIATLFYEFYDDIEVLTQQLAKETEQIQCLVAKTDRTGFVAFGQTQQPQLWNYADKVDTIQFLTKL